MVSKVDPRHLKRRKIVQALYALSFESEYQLSKELEEIFEKIKKNLETIDKYIAKYSIKLPFEKIAKVDLAILRLGVYELLFEKTNPPKVVIDEAVELAKELGSDRSYAFVNAVLGRVYEELGKTSEKDRN